MMWILIRRTSNWYPGHVGIFLLGKYLSEYSSCVELGRLHLDKILEVIRKGTDVGVSMVY